MEVWRSDDGLTVSESGVALFENVTIVDWSPSASWRMGFGARTGSDFDGHYLANMTLHTGAHLRVESVAVEVTLNHQSYTENDVQLSYMPPPAVSALSVDRGPEDGGTLDGLLPPLEGTALYSAACRANHACAPNCDVIYEDGGPLRVSLVAARDIREGEELTISYVDSDQDAVDRRARSLRTPRASGAAALQPLLLTKRSLPPKQ
mgnify:CR=1 FL=1